MLLVVLYFASVTQLVVVFFFDLVVLSLSFTTNETVENEPKTKIILCCLCFCWMQTRKKAKNVGATQQVSA